MNARCFACGTSFTAHSGREDYSLRARRHTSSLHCTAANSIAFQSTKPRVARSICRVKERVSRLRRHPFARGRFTGDSTPCHTLPKQVRPTSFLFVDCPSIASPASPIRSEQCRHNALRTFIKRPPQTPMHGQTKSILHCGSASTATLAPRFVGQGGRSRHPTHISAAAR